MHAHAKLEFVKIHSQSRKKRRYSTNLSWCTWQTGKEISWPAGIEVNVWQRLLGKTCDNGERRRFTDDVETIYKHSTRIDIESSFRLQNEHSLFCGNIRG